MNPLWPIGSVHVARQTFYAGGEAIDGGRTLGGVATLSREPGGGWATLDYEFPPFVDRTAAPRLVSWLMMAVRNGRVFRLPIVVSPQLVPASAFNPAFSVATDRYGLPWSNRRSWANGENWAFNPMARAVGGTVPAGSTQLLIDMTSYGQILWHGHVIGEGAHAYLVEDIEYEGAAARVTVTPPLRRAVASGARIKFRPTMTGVCTTPESFEALYEPGGFIRPGSISFTEVVV